MINIKIDHSGSYGRKRFGVGKTGEEALGNLLWHHQDYFKVKLIVQEKLIMADDKIKAQVYKLLLELFKDDCPDFEDYRKDETLKDVWFNYGVWTILRSILPAVIHHYDKKHYIDARYSKVIKQKICTNGKSLYYIEYEHSYFPKDAKPLLYSSKEYPALSWDYNIWQSLKSLLDAIKSKQGELESHKDRDKMKFVWGKEK